MDFGVDLGGLEKGGLGGLGEQGGLGRSDGKDLGMDLGWIWDGFWMDFGWILERIWEGPEKWGVL